MTVQIGMCPSYFSYDALCFLLDADDSLLWEYVSEAFREYMEEPKRLEAKDMELYDLIAGAVE